MEPSDGHGVIDRLPEHLKTRRTAEALTAPSAILLAGATASIAILTGLPLLAAAGIGVLAWGARVALGLPRRPAAPRIDPATLSEPWRGFVRDALDATGRYKRALKAAMIGPLRDRLTEIGERLDAGVQECWRIARQGDALEHAIGDLDIQSAKRELASLQNTAGDPGDESTNATIESLQAQIASSDRLAKVARDASSRLRLLDARLDEAVARAVELSLRAGDVSELGGLGSDVDALVGEMESLRLGLEEAGQASSPGFG